MSVQLVARHLRVPGIILLLAAGVLLGPDVLGEPGVNGAMVERMGGRVLFAVPRRLEQWSQRVERGEAELRRWRYEAVPEGESTGFQALLSEFSERLLPLLLRRGKKTILVDESLELVTGDEVLGLVSNVGAGSNFEIPISSGLSLVSPSVGGG